MKLNVVLGLLATCTFLTSSPSLAMDGPPSEEQSKAPCKNPWKAAAAEKARITEESRTFLQTLEHGLQARNAANAEQLRIAAEEFDAKRVAALEMQLMNNVVPFIKECQSNGKIVKTIIGNSTLDPKRLGTDCILWSSVATRGFGGQPYFEGNWNDKLIVSTVVRVLGPVIDEFRIDNWGAMGTARLKWDTELIECLSKGMKPTGKIEVPLNPFTENRGKVSSDLPSDILNLIQWSYDGYRGEFGLPELNKLPVGFTMPVKSHFSGDLKEWNDERKETRRLIMEKKYLPFASAPFREVFNDVETTTDQKQCQKFPCSPKAILTAKGPKS